MQGRLSPPLPDNPQYFPLERWEDEFPLARELGFDGIEWLFDTSSQHTNPLLTAKGRERVKEIVADSGIMLRSICADYFKDNSLATDDSAASRHRVEVLIRLIQGAAELEIDCVLIPFLEGSAIARPELRRRAQDALKRPLAVAASLGISLAVETDLPASVLATWLEDTGHAFLNVYYDLGNAVALGYDPSEEILLLGPRIRGVHIKDRTLNGPNVPLGTGSVDFDTCSRSLRKVGYKAPLVLETVRGDNYIVDAKRHLDFVKEIGNALDAG